MASPYGVPVALVTGDDKVIMEIMELVPEVVGAEVKRGLVGLVLIVLVQR